MLAMRPSTDRGCDLFRQRKRLRASALWILVLVNSVARPSVLEAQKEQNLLPYLQSSVGDLWTFEARSPSSVGRAQTASARAAGSTAFAISVDEITDTGKEAVRRDQSNGDYRLQHVDDQGLWLHSVHFPGDRAVVYEYALLLIPATLAVGATHETEVDYRSTELGRSSGGGTQSFEVHRLPDESMTTPLGRFDRCLVLRIRGRRVAAEGDSSSYELTVWLAPGVGEVRLSGQTEAATGAERTVDVVLGGALIDGRGVEAGG